MPAGSSEDFPCAPSYSHRCPPFLSTLKTDTEFGIRFSYSDDLILMNKHVAAGLQNCIFNITFKKLEKNGSDDFSHRYWCRRFVRKVTSMSKSVSTFLL
jgi:hypothetical protein